jgi:LuxR family maltose regulon positive regulatory protein
MGDPPSGLGWHSGVVAEPPIPLLWAKLTPPRLHPEAVVRHDLLDELAGANRHRDEPPVALTALVAPPGYGKTTVAVQLAQCLADHGGFTTAWVSLEPADDEPVRFWTYVAASFGAAGVDGVEATYGLLAAGADGVPAASLALRAAVEGHAGPITLVLDDLQAVGDGPVADSLDDWLRRPLANLRIICTSRRDLPLSVGRLRGQGLLTEARAPELAFQPTEMEALLSGTFGLARLSTEQLTALEKRTEGWPVGVYLAGLTLRDETDVADGIKRFTGDGRHLSEYLAAEATDGVDGTARAFALATSILPVLDPDLCDAVTDGVGSLRVLRQLAADNVFISALDDAGTLFTYHPLFREHLRSALQADHPEQLGDLHRRASEWHEANGEIESAIEHAAAAGDVERGERLLAQVFLAFANAGHFGTIIGLVDRMGPRADRTTETALMMAWLSLNVRHYDDLDQWLEVAAANSTGDADAVAVSLHRPAILLHRARHVGDVGSMTILAADAAAAANAMALEAVEPDLHIGEPARGSALSASGSALYWAGDPEGALARLTEALAIARRHRITLEQIFCYQYLAMIEADAGRWETALAHADQALAGKGADGEHYRLPTLAHLARASALVGMGRPADAAAALDDARRVAAYRSEPLYDGAIELMEARLRHLAGDRDGARSAIRACQAIIDQLPDPQFESRLREAENSIRFVAVDAEALPVGARELTDRERSVLALLPHGLSRRELARQLHVSENTIKTHLTSIRHKLGVVGRESIVDRAVDLGLLDHDQL